MEMIDEKDNGVITNYYKDLSTGRPIVKIKTEKQTVNSLKNVIQLIETPDEQERVTIVDSTDMVEVDNYEDLTEENQYWVDYKNPLGNIYFHPSKKAQTYNIKYGSKGYTLISANKIFTKLDEDGNVVEVLSDILEQGRDIIDELLILGGGVQVFYKLQQAIADGSELHTNLQSDISTGQPLHTQLRKDINDANTFKDQLNEDVADGKILDESLKVQNPRAEQNLANLNQAMTDCADDIANITKTDNGVAIVTTENWGSVDSEGFYHCTVTHTANSKDLNLDIFDYTNNIQGESVFVTVTPLTNTTFKVSSIENTPIKIVFASGYYGGYTSTNTRDAINSLENEKQNKIDNLLETTNKSIPLAINEVKSQLEETTNKLGNKLNKDRVVAENKKDSTLPLMELFSYAGQEDLSKIIALILHHYADGDVVQLDNVGEGNCILRLKNAYNPLHRPDKGESFIGTGNFLELCFHNLDTGKQVILGRIDKDGNFTWSEFAKTITFRHNKADDGTAPFQISIGTKHSTLFRFLNANSTVLEILNDGANGLKAHFRSGSGQTDGMQFEARKGNLDLVALNGYVTINGDSNNKALSTGTTSRPTNPFEGQIWYNRGSKKYEFWNGSAWNVFQ